MSKILPISVIVLTHNEEKNIRDCLKSVYDWAGEIFVVDSGSTDQTLDLVSEYTDKIVHHPFENYSQQRNWSQDHLPIKYDWVFHIDADERVTEGLVEELSAFFDDEHRVKKTAGLMVKRKIEFMGRMITHGGLYPTYHQRIFKKNAGHCEDRVYDQHFVIEGPVERIDEDLIDVTASDLFSWTNRHNRWAQLEAQHYLLDEEEIDGTMVEPKLTGSPIERRRWMRESILDRSPLFIRSFLYFLYRYIFLGGFLDGKEGLIYHVLQGFWFRFYIDSCIYEKRNHPDKES